MLLAINMLLFFSVFCFAGFFFFEVVVVLFWFVLWVFLFVCFLLFLVLVFVHYISTTLLDIAVDMYDKFVKAVKTLVYSFQFP